MEPLLERVGRGEVLLADGAMGTQLFKRGVQAGACPEVVALDRPEVLSEIARLYLDAGAEIVQTNTFGASPAKLSQYGLEAQTEDINRAAVAAVRAAVDGRAYVSGSCGPSGKILKPYGDAELSDLEAGFARQVGAMAEAGVDLVCVETMTDLNEASAAVRAAKAAAPQLPVMATMTFDPTPRGFYTIMGVTVPQACAALAEAGADLIGSNCGNGIDTMVEVARAFAEHSPKPVVIQSNAGLPELVDGEPAYKETPDFMSERVAALVDAKVVVIGGCCGTTPEHIAAMRKALDALADAS